MSENNLKPWQKTLYGNHGYPDNYTDPSFLQDMQTNKDVKIFNLSEAIRGAARVNQQITCITMFLQIFHRMRSHQLYATHVLIMSLATTLLGYIVHIIRCRRRRPPQPQEQESSSSSNEATSNVSNRTAAHAQLVDDSKTVFCVLTFGYIMAPMLHTLTNSISTDTIFTMTFFVLIIHIVCFDYGVPAFIVSKAVSVNAAIFGTICLASRLATSLDAFALLVVAAQFFVLFPIFAKHIKSPIQLLMLMAIVCCAGLYNASETVLVLYVLVIGFVNIVCPYIFVRQQRYKNNINGPWDEAIVKDADILMMAE